MNGMPSHAVWWYLHELTSRVVAESGIANDRYHLGKILLQSFKDAPDFIMQIDGATDERDTFRSALERSIRCASAFRNIGLKYQDVVLIMAPNYLDLTMPIYAAFYLGIMVAGADMHLGVNELQDTIKYIIPKIIFCDNSNANTVKEALNSLNMSAHIITFGAKGNHMSFIEFVEANAGDATVDNFKPADFDPKVTIALLAATSGSTGLPKSAILTHENVFVGFPTVMLCSTNFPSPIDIGVVLSPIQWLSALFQLILSPIFRYTRLQSSSPSTPDHVYFLINKYKPEFTIMSPTFMTTLFKPGERDKCDFSSFKYIIVGGSAVNEKLLGEVKKVAPNVTVHIGYGMTEASGLVAISLYSPKGSIGVPLSNVFFKLVDPVTNEVIQEPKVAGELRVKGPTVGKGYYNNPEMTNAVFDEDGYFKSGDVLYRDEYYNLYFVDRLKLLLKYRNHQVSPVEIESVILTHPGVLDVAVTGVPDDECGDLPVAFVIPRGGFHVTPDEIKDLVKVSLTDTKQLRGGVVFLKELPTTSTSKVDRQELKKMASSLKNK